ncbi:YgcG family protein [Emticicia sp. 21SJ11W-3]|uniref:TPM domain-containing protein n=1 Tax=Emticicia sp. 21SJ11W-3 TaxID=2916755 RepID=UPI00209F2D0F|nr:TPM domain-containing protein [Emticicia sp. 21SJ11W-3]UTA68172.1 TPM domain-containing protein [Emticicia sp. 21SJ11W-3]
MFKKLLILFFLLQSLAFAQDIPEKPNPARFVNDFVGGLLSPDQTAQLEAKLKGYYDTTSTQITIVIVKTVQPYDISEYAFKLGKAWGIGEKGKNNGIVVLWAPGDRKVFIATGYGMEGTITDAYSKRIIEKDIKPRFKEARYYEGLDVATDKIINYAKGEFKDDKEDDGDGSWLGFVVVIIIIFVIIAILSRGKGGNHGNRGGGGWIPYTTFTGWGSSSGGWSGGGDSGGFGGFGGGDFGGGGAGGDY